MKKLVFVILLCLGSHASCASGPAFPGGFGQYGVGLRVAQLYDRSRIYPEKTDLVTGAITPGERARPMQLLVWYPAEKQSGVALRYADYVRTIATEEQFKRDDAEIEHSAIAYIQYNYSSEGIEHSMPALDQPMQARRDSKPVPGKLAECVSWRGDALPAQLPGLALDTRRPENLVLRKLAQGHFGHIPTFDGDIAIF